MIDLRINRECDWLHATINEEDNSKNFIRFRFKETKDKKKIIRKVITYLEDIYESWEN